MKTLTLIIYFILTLSWLFILIFSAKEIIKSKLSSKSLFTILFTILLIDSLRTFIESLYFGTRLSSQYGILSKEVFEILSNPNLLVIPKVINAIAALAIIFIILKKWYPNKLKDDLILQEKLDKEKQMTKHLDTLLEEKNKELEELNKNLEKRIDLEVQKNKHQEEAMINQSKMVAMGEMLRNIAHQWRQPLSTITTLSSGTKLNIEMNMANEKMLFENLDKITETGQYLSQTIDDFQNFFKPTQNSEEFNCNDLIKKATNLLDASIKANDIRLVVESHCNCTLYGPYNEYIQVIINLINNAKDALVENKKENRLIIVSLRSEKNNCLVTVMDNAGGIPDDIINRVFEPYFTTKHQSQGTGIGLYMSKEIIEKHMKGSITVQNVEHEYLNIIEKGAEFTIRVGLTHCNSGDCCS